MERRIPESEVCRKLKFLNHRCGENFSFGTGEDLNVTPGLLRWFSAAPAVAAHEAQRPKSRTAPSERGMTAAVKYGSKLLVRLMAGYLEYVRPKP